MIQAIDGDGAMQQLAALSAFVQAAVPAGTGERYHTIGVFGGQSSGKSTLLNRCFGTTFETMSSERQQTTRGAFLSRSVHDIVWTPEGSSADGATEALPLLVFDCEGADGAERSEDQSLEKKLALFALGVCDTLVINMWHSEVNRFNAANLSLLRTVFEISLKLLAQRERKMTLLFVLRDVTDVTKDMDALERAIERNMAKLWGEMTKTAPFEGSVIGDVFAVQFVGLSHYVHQRAAFDAEVLALRARFCTAGAGAGAGALFASDRCIRSVPADGLPQYMANLWSAISSLQELDIPTQRDLLAQCRCSDFTDAALASFALDCAALKTAAAALATAGGGPGEPRPLRPSQTLAARAAALCADFDEKTALYAGAVVSATRARLAASLARRAKAAVGAYASALASAELRRVDGAVGDIVASAVRALAAAAADEANAPKPARSPLQRTARRVRAFYAAVAAKADGVVAGLAADWAAGGPTATEADATAEAAAASAANAKGGDAASEGATGTTNADALRSDPRLLSAAIAAARTRVAAAVAARLRGLAAEAATHAARIFDDALDTDEKTGTRGDAPRTEAVLRKRFPAARHAGLLFFACVFALRLAPLRGFASDADVDAVAAEAAAVAATSLDVGAPEEAPAPPVYPLRLLSSGGGAITATDDAPATAAAENENESDGESGAADIEGAKTNDTAGVAVVLGPREVAHAYALFDAHATHALQVRLLGLRNGQQPLPLWVFVALAVFGWNEFVWLVTNPVLLVAVCAATYIFAQQFLVEQWGRFEERFPGAAGTVRFVAGEASRRVGTIRGDPVAAGAAATNTTTTAAAATSKKNQ